MGASLAFKAVRSGPRFLHQIVRDCDLVPDIDLNHWRVSGEKLDLPQAGRDCLGRAQKPAPPSQKGLLI